MRPNIEPAQVAYLLKFLQGRQEELRAAPSRHSDGGDDEDEYQLVSRLYGALLTTYSMFEQSMPVVGVPVDATELQPWDVAIWPLGEPFAIVTNAVECPEHQPPCRLVTFLAPLLAGHSVWTAHLEGPQNVARINSRSRPGPARLAT